MTPPARPPRAAAFWFRRPRPTARLRLTAIYGGLFMAASISLLAFTYWLFQRATAHTVAATSRALTQHLCAPQSRPTPGLAPGQHTGPGLAPIVFCVKAIAVLSSAHEVDLHVLLVLSAIGLAVMAALAVALGWLVAGRVLRPLRAITATARRISASSLHERLALEGPDDEFKELADTLNELLRRLDTSFQAQRHFVASASHELRTPLTLDRTLLQVALRDAGATVDQWRSTGAEVLESGRQQERLLEALLTLASSEGGLSRRERVDLSQVTAAGLHAAAGRIERQRLDVRMSLSPAPTLGDPALIERLAANLVDNAVQHNTPGGMIELTTARRAGRRAVLAVANSGPAIPPGDIERLFQPFQRLAPVRASNSHDHGHGLGLSIVRAIATAHGAALTAHARPEGGLHIELSFPADDARAVSPAAQPGHNDQIRACAPCPDTRRPARAERRRQWRRRAR